jgi:hypothetical protein
MRCWKIPGGGMIHDATCPGASATPGHSPATAWEAGGRTARGFVEDCRSRQPILVAGLDGRSLKLPKIACNSI